MDASRLDYTLPAPDGDPFDLRLTPMLCLGCLCLAPPWLNGSCTLFRSIERDRMPAATRDRGVSMARPLAHEILSGQRPSYPPSDLAHPVPPLPGPQVPASSRSIMGAMRSRHNFRSPCRSSLTSWAFSERLSGFGVRTRRIPVNTKCDRRGPSGTI